MDVEKLIADYLRDETGLRVRATPPNDRASAWVQLTEIGAPQDPNSRVYHHVHHYLQLDCYAGIDGGVPEANAVAEAVIESLMTLGGVQDGAVVTFVRIEGSLRDLDVEEEPARDRRVVTATVGMHPA